MGGATLIDKWRQLRQAIALEHGWTKDQILEAWLNLTPFRGGRGRGHRGARLLGKRVGELDRIELAARRARAPNAPHLVSRDALACCSDATSKHA